METTDDRRRIVAREGLLDAVKALGPHGDAVILVGAQAVYVHTEAEDASFAVSPFTYDADIVLDPALLGDSPRIVDAMRGAEFGLTDQPGMYRRQGGAQVDLLVPAAVGGPGRRGGTAQCPRQQGGDEGPRPRGRTRQPHFKDDRLPGAQ